MPTSLIFRSFSPIFAVGPFWLWQILWLNLSVPKIIFTQCCRVILGCFSKLPTANFNTKIFVEVRIPNKSVCGCRNYNLKWGNKIMKWLNSRGFRMNSFVFGSTVKTFLSYVYFFLLFVQIASKFSLCLLWVREKFFLCC